MKKIFFFKDYLQTKYGRPLYRIPIDLPLSCPHRQKNHGIGCVFCSETGARARHLSQNLDLAEQVKLGTEYVTRRYGVEDGFIAYFQSFTNTNAPVDTLRAYYSEVLSLANFAMVIISTRPDCLPDDVLDYLVELNKSYDLWVELGVQSVHDHTLELINRGHDFNSVEQAVAKLADRGIPVAAHMILGLPGEGPCEFRESADKIASMPFSGVKIHHLQVLKNTPLAKTYAKQNFPTLNEYEYAGFLVDFLRRLPDDWPVMRLKADAASEDLIAPKWWMKKGQFIEYVKELMLNSENDSEVDNFPKVATKDGSFTFYHPEYRQHFHSLAGARGEALNKFIIPSGIEKKMADTKALRVLDIGFGLGYNCLETLKTAIKTGFEGLSIVSLENELKTIKLSERLCPETSEEKKILTHLLESGEWQENGNEIKIIIDDARKAIGNLQGQFDAIYLDAFSPEVNPELWTYDFFRVLKSILADDGVLLTYSSAFPVRGGLIRNGFKIGLTSPFGRRQAGTIASLEATPEIEPLSEKEMNVILKSTAGVPYRDPGLTWSRKKIREFRARVVAKLRAKGIPKWYKGA